MAEDVAIIPQPTRQGWSHRLGRMLHWRHLFRRKKRGSKVGKTKRGKGSKCMVVVDGKGLPLGVSIASASPAEVKLAPESLATITVPRGGPGRSKTKPKRLIADKAYDSDPFRESLGKRRIEFICPHRRNRVKPPTQDGRKLRRYRRRWIVERTIAWLGSFRRLIVRHEYSPRMFLAFIHFACALLTLRGL